MRRAIVYVGRGLLWLVVALCLTAVIVPKFLDRIYYEGPASTHFDGERFFNPDRDSAPVVPGGGGISGWLWRSATGGDGRPPWPSKVKVIPAKPEARVEGERMVATWVGHATWLVQTNGLNILTDPIWANTSGPFGIGPRRVAEPGIRFEDLPKIDLVVVSHNHYDHMDLATLKRLWDRDKPLIVTSLGNDTVMNAGGVQATALEWGDNVDIRRCHMHDMDCLRAPSKGRVHVTRNHH